MFIAYCIFSPTYSNKLQKRLRVVVVTFGIFLLLVFGALTIGRFGVSEYNADNNVESSVADYFGQSTLNYSADILQNDTYQWGDGTMPFFRQLLGLPYSKNIYDRQARWGKSMTIEQGAFYTYIGDICCDFSPYLAFILVLFVSLLFDKRINGGSCRNINASRLFLLFFICCICYDGLFYYSFKTIGGNLKLIMNFLFYFFISLKSVKNGKIISYT
jgi:oligosaccharide repeat unit polymerase